MKSKACHAFAFWLALPPNPASTSTWYHGKNITMNRTTPLTPATISPKLMRDVSTGLLLRSLTGSEAAAGL